VIERQCAFGPATAAIAEPDNEISAVRSRKSTVERFRGQFDP
jgi:hypothetical protein